MTHAEWMAAAKKICVDAGLCQPSWQTQDYEFEFYGIESRDPILALGDGEQENSWRLLFEYTQKDGDLDKLRAVVMERLILGERDKG